MAADQTRTTEWMGTEYRVLVSSEQSGGHVALYVSQCPPEQGPPRHVHHREDELFYILSGDVEFWMDGDRSRKGPGGAMFMPRGREHTFRVAGTLPARMLTVLTPGGFEGFFFEMAERNCRIPQDMDEVARIAGRHNLTFTGPPLEAE